ncbi:TPA: hypothetical protein ACGFUY_002602 [Flavobacterium psychrophilum]
MNKIIKLIVLIFPCLIFSQNDFSNGYKEGYKSGYCYEQGYGCIPPIPPIAPIPRVGESTYTDGYNRGFSDGKNKRSSEKSNSNYSTTPTTTTSTYTPTSMDEMMILAKARQQNNGNNSNGGERGFLTEIIMLPFEMLINWDQISLSPAFAFSNPNNKAFKKGYGINLDGRFGDNNVDFVYGYSYMQYNQDNNSEIKLKQHSVNIGLGINVFKNSNIQMELTPLLEYELNNQKDFGYGGYFGFKKMFLNKKISIGSRYKYTTVSNQISLNLIYKMK